MVLVRFVLRIILTILFKLLYRVEVRGVEHLKAAGNRVMVIANHTSFLDPPLLAVFLPDTLTFAIDTRMAKRWWIKPLLLLVESFPMDPTNPSSLKSFIQYLQQDKKAIIFPEGRITVTGALMKIYEGPGLVADKSGAMLLPVRIDGAEYTPFSRLKGRVRIRWFPKITLTIQKPKRITPPAEITGRERRDRIGKQLADIMTEMMFETSQYDTTLAKKLLDAKSIHGGRHLIVNDTDFKPLTYSQFIRRCFILGRVISKNTQKGELVGILLPNLGVSLLVFFALQMRGRIPVMLNYSTGEKLLEFAISESAVSQIYTSRKLIALTKLKPVVNQLKDVVQFNFVEDVPKIVGAQDVTIGSLQSMCPRFWHKLLAGKIKSGDPAVVLFTTGSEGDAKGVVLSHANLLANREQLVSRLDFNSRDVVLNALPLYHAFGLSGALLAIFSGIPLFLYPSPLHYRVVPEISYAIGATVLFSTDTFLQGYAQHAHPYDFYCMRYVFCGAEKLKHSTAQLWMNKFGIRILEGYGVTEASPVISANTPMDYKKDSVGRLLPGIHYQLQDVPHLNLGKKFQIQGPNIMLGYLKPVEQRAEHGLFSRQQSSWYNTGDLVEIDEDGFLFILGRLKRVAKINGEMVSFALVEQVANAAYPDSKHAVVCLADEIKGEELILVTEEINVDRKRLLEQIKQQGLTEIHLPSHYIVLPGMPQTATGKLDYVRIEEFARMASENVRDVN